MLTQQESLGMVHLKEFPDPPVFRTMSLLRDTGHQGIYSQKFLD